MFMYPDKPHRRKNWKPAGNFLDVHACHIGNGECSKWGSGHRDDGNGESRV